MPTTRAAGVFVLAVAAALFAGSAHGAPTPPELRILLFTKTAGFRHDSIPVAVRALRELGARNRVQVDHTEDAALFTDAGLRRYDAVVFLLTSGDVLDAAQQAAFERFIGSGRGYAGVHSASDTEYDWPWYGGLVGAFFRSHPAIQRATVRVLDRRHPSTRTLPGSWTRTDEWFAFRSNPRGAVNVLATLDETTYSPGDASMGADHPTAWSHAYEGGRAWYTAGGHAQESYAEPLFVGHVFGGILWAAGPPRILSLSGTARRGRLAVTGRKTRCLRCRAEVRVVVRGQARVTRLVVDGGSVRGQTGVLPAGRWRYTVVIADDASGQRTTVRRTVTVR